MYSKLSRNSAQRKALLRDLVTDLIINEKIETTLSKAKELQKLADRMITLGKKGDLSSIRRASRLVRNELVKEDQTALQKLFKELAPKFKGRSGGYTRIYKLGTRRGDNAPLALIEFVE